MLYICPTPIGNLEDVTVRVLSVLRNVDLIACEDTRRTRILLDRYGIAARMMSFHEHNEEQRLRTLLPLLREGKNIAVVSDAGMPGLSDPGFTLVRACAAEGLAVTVLPGSSAVPTALVAAGLPADRFAFVGFLARGKKQRVEQIEAFDGTDAAVVAFESPRRLRATLTAVGSRWPDRRLAVCRELTKMHEQVLRGTAAEVQEALPESVRGEIVLVLEPAAGGRQSPDPARPEGVTSALHAGSGRKVAGFAAVGAARPGGESTAAEEKARAALRELLPLGVGTKKAAAVIAALTGIPSRRVYELALEVKEGGPAETGMKETHSW
jgi:16S rRNA (cytidine1402-2'-O)-methyltransferase